MDLTIQDVAQLLSESNKCVEEWVEQGSIPCYRIGDEYLFSRMEIEDWMMRGLRPKSEEPSSSSLGQQQYSLFRAIQKGHVFHEVPGNCKQEVMDKAIYMIAEELELDPEVLNGLLKERESMQSTGIGHGIALPHTREAFFGNQFDYVFTVFPKNEIEDYGAIDGKPVHILFFLFARDDKKHLHILSKVAHMVSDLKIREVLKRRPTKKHLLEIVRDWETSLQ